MLPDGDGEEVLRKVRDEGLPTRVVVSTGTDDPVRLALVKGMDADAMFREADRLRRGLPGVRGRDDLLRGHPGASESGPATGWRNRRTPSHTECKSPGIGAGGSFICSLPRPTVFAPPSPARDLIALSDP